jgi:hypothetical protein
MNGKEIIKRLGQGLSGCRAFLYAVTNMQPAIHE